MVLLYQPTNQLTFLGYLCERLFHSPALCFMMVANGTMNTKLLSFLPYIFIVYLSFPWDVLLSIYLCSWYYWLILVTDYHFTLCFRDDCWDWRRWILTRILVSCSQAIYIYTKWRLMTISAESQCSPNGSFERSNSITIFNY